MQDFMVVLQYESHSLIASIEKRLSYSKEHISKPVSFWNTVIFSDESKFNLYRSDGQYKVWRQVGKELDPKNTIKTVKYGDGFLPCLGVCQVIYSQFGLAIHQNDHQARRRFVEWAQNEIAVVPDFHKRILFSDEAHFWLNGYVNKQNCRIWSEANPQVYVETPLHPEKLTVWCALWAGGILLQKR
ncbi:hypothetical protein TNCV_2187711 [Trichonephila clavipes]|nr:hypothetical protein TNCV_2187711 [Trichonephila clavipes]